MKIHYLLATLLMTTTVVSAQPQPMDPPPRPRELESAEPNGPREKRRPLDQWMTQMKEQHPEDYARLMELRESDPDAFAEALRSRRDRLRGRNMEAGMAEMPRFRQMMEELSPEEREHMAERFSRVMRAQARRPGPESRQISEGERNAKKLATAYREAPDAQREAVMAELRIQVEEIFELREAELLRQIEEGEKHLNRLKEAMEKRREQREKIVGHRLKELTQDRPPSR